MLPECVLMFVLISTGIQVDCLASAPAGTNVAIARSDARIEVVDVTTGDVLADFSGAGRVSGLTWCGPKLLSVVVDIYSTSRDMDVQSGCRTWELWDVDSKQRVASRRSLPCPTIPKVIPSPDGKRILITAFDGGARILSADALQDVFSLHGRFNCGCWTPDGSHVLLGGEDGTVLELDVADGRTVHAEKEVMRCVRCMAVDRAGKTLVVGGQDQIARVYELPTWKPIASWKSKTGFPMEWNGFERIVLSPAGDVAYLTTTDWWSIQAWSLKSNTCVWWVDLDAGNPWPVEEVLSPDGSRLAFARYDSPRILDTQDGRTCAAFAIENRPSDPQSFGWTADGRFFLMRSADRTGVTVHGGRALVPLFVVTPTETGIKKRTFLAAR